MAAEPQQYTQRLVVLGAAGVGKSAIVAQFLFETFTEKYKKTVEELYCTEYDVYETKLPPDEPTRGKRGGRSQAKASSHIPVRMVHSPRSPKRPVTSPLRLFTPSLHQALPRAYES
ncbi:RAP1B [Branchiostoma lanceolatum]|uniref:RAP1B protein n=1 Tax=Branchiostoma lanceolatum TaxID=7740 RepID=A0A8K0AEM7_BRALA|nr:RAP1B [Branchiostoma lanceolatum]